VTRAPALVALVLLAGCDVTPEKPAKPAPTAAATPAKPDAAPLPPAERLAAAVRAVPPAKGSRFVFDGDDKLIDAPFGPVLLRHGHVADAGHAEAGVVAVYYLRADGDGFALEGEELRIVPLGHTDTSHTTALHIPSLDLVIAGDAVYNETHLYLAECDAAARSEWLRALDIIEALQPKAVVAGHAVTDQDGSPRHIAATRRYIQDFNATLAKAATHLDLYNAMLALYPDRVNPGSLWATAKAAKPPA